MIPVWVRVTILITGFTSSTTEFWSNNQNLFRWKSLKQRLMKMRVCDLMCIKLRAFNTKRLRTTHLIWSKINQNFLMKGTWSFKFHDVCLLKLPKTKFLKRLITYVFNLTVSFLYKYENKYKTGMTAFSPLNCDTVWNACITADKL